jgi:hypothetical protein
MLTIALVMGSSAEYHIADLCVVLRRNKSHLKKYKLLANMSNVIQATMGDVPWAIAYAIF